MKAFARWWNEFWFKPTPTSSIAVLRVAYGVVMLGWAISLAPDLLLFFSPNGLLPRQPASTWGVGVLRYVNSPAAVIALYTVLVVAAVFVILGFKTRLSTVVLFVCLISFQRRNPYLETGADTVLRLIGLYLMLMPAGVSLSLDRWRKAKDKFWEFPERSPWAQRLLMVQVSFMYLFTVYLKVQGRTWNNGTAVSYALRIGEYIRMPVPDFIVNSLPIMNLLTWGTLVIELSMAILIWNRRLRPWVMLGGISLHLAIDITMKVGFFSPAVLVMYIAFVPEDTMAKWLVNQRDRVRRWLGREPARSPEPPAPVEAEPARLERVFAE